MLRMLKRYITIGIIILLLALATLASSIPEPLNNAAILPSPAIYVPDNYSKIQDAVNNAPEGSTIIVRDGIYVENIVVNKRLTIVSQNGPRYAVVMPADPNKPIFNITSNNVTISGFTLTRITVGFVRGSTGISLNANYSVIYNNIIVMDNQEYGIGLSRSYYNAIYNNTILSLYTVTHMITGIYLVWSSNNRIYLNSLSLPSYDFVSASRGVYLLVSSNNEVYLNSISVSGGDALGIDLFSSNSNRIYLNSISVSGHRSAYGIQLQRSNNSNIYLNDLSIYSNYSAYGVFFVDSNSSEVYLNNISVSGRWYLNLSYGMYFANSANNRIYLNNFLPPGSYYIYSVGTINYWITREKLTYTYKGRNFTNYLGNYWSNYQGSDSDGDGIGDTPRVIDPLNADEYPLIERVESYGSIKPSIQTPTPIPIATTVTVPIPIATTVTIVSTVTATVVSPNTVTMIWPVTTTTLVSTVTVPITITTIAAAPGQTVTLVREAVGTVTETERIMVPMTATLTAVGQAVTMVRTITESVTVWGLPPIALIVSAVMVITSVIIAASIIRRGR